MAHANFIEYGETVTAQPSIPITGEEVIPEEIDLHSTKSEKQQYNFSSIKKKKKSSPPPIKKPKLQEEQKQKLPTIPKHSIRYALNERSKECKKKSNLMKNAKILKGIQADEEILTFFRPNEKPFIYKLLKFLRMNGDVITWDDDTLEVNING